MYYKNVCMYVGRSVRFVGMYVGLYVCMYVWMHVLIIVF